MLEYKATFPPTTANDVVTREVTMTINGGTPDVSTYPVTTGEFNFFAPDNATVSLFLVDIDDAGNRSQPSPSTEFTATDTLPPPAPGAIGVTLVGES